MTYSDRRALLSIPRGFDLAPARADRRLLPRQHRDAHPRRAQPPAGAAADRRSRASTPCWWRRNSRSTRSIHRAARSGSQACSRNSSTKPPSAHAPARRSARAQRLCERAPVVIVAYSGGYNPAAFALARRRRQRAHPRRHPARRHVRRIRQVRRLAGEAAERVLLQRLWQGGANRARRIAEAADRPRRRLPDRVAAAADAGQHAPSSMSGDQAVHNDFVTRAWTADPLKLALARMPGFSRTGGAPPKR